MSVALVEPWPLVEWRKHKLGREAYARELDGSLSSSKRVPSFSFNSLALQGSATEPHLQFRTRLGSLSSNRSKGLFLHGETLGIPTRRPPVDELVGSFQLLLLQDSRKPAASQEVRMTDVDYVLQFDGGSRGNTSSSPAGAGAVIFSSKNGDRKAILETSVFLNGTNNEAEYSALIHGLEMALNTLRASELSIEGDSELVVRQIKGVYKVRKPHLVPLFTKSKELLAQFARYSISHVPRAANAYADRLANLAMDEKKTRPPSPPSTSHAQIPAVKDRERLVEGVLHVKSTRINKTAPLLPKESSIPSRDKFKDIGENEIHLFKDLRVIFEEGENKSLLLTFPYNIECSNLMKKHIFGMRWNKTTKNWSCPQQGIQDLVHLFDKVKLPLPPEVREMATSLPPLIKRKAIQVEKKNWEANKQPWKRRKK